MADQQNKADGGKSNPLLLEADMVHALELVNRVLDYGAEKYERKGWKKVEQERYYAALRRHLREVAKGEMFDDESGLPHLAHIACNALFLTQFLADSMTERRYKQALGYKPPAQDHKALA